MAGSMCIRCGRTVMSSGNNAKRVKVEGHSATAVIHKRCPGPWVGAERSKGLTRRGGRWMFA